MLIKIAIFTVIGLSAAVLLGLRVLWPKLRRALLEVKLGQILSEQQRVLRLQRILELPDAYERLMVEGIVQNAMGHQHLTFIASPTAREVEAFMAANREVSSSYADYSLDYLLVILKAQARSIRAELKLDEGYDKPTDRRVRLIEQRAKVVLLEHQLSDERQQLERLEIQDRPPDPYGRLPPRTHVEQLEDVTEFEDPAEVLKKRA